MPKLKTHKGTSKRIKTTASSKLTRSRAFGGHMLAKKTKSRKRRINTSASVGGSIAKNVKKALGI